MGGLTPELRRSVEASIHEELHPEVVRHDGGGLAPISSSWTSLVPAGAALDIVNPGSGPNGYAPVPETYSPARRIFLRSWFSRKDSYDWHSFDNVLSGFVPVDGPVSFGWQGSCKGVSHFIGLDPDHAPAVTNLLRASHPNTWIEQTDLFSAEAGWLLGEREGFRFGFCDLRPAGSYLARLRIPAKSSPPPSAPVVVALSQLTDREYGFYEVVFRSDVAGFPEKLRMLSAVAEQSARLGVSGQYASASLSHDIVAMSGAHEKLNDRMPFFFIAIRCGLCCEESRFETMARALVEPILRLPYGDRPFRCVTGQAYRQALGDSFRFAELIGTGRTFAPGFPVTATELSGLCHYPSDQMVEDTRYPLDRVWGVEYMAKEGAVDGVYLGDNVYGGKKTPVIQPYSQRRTHTLYCGATGMGKSTMQVSSGRQVMEHDEGGLTFIDPHGEAEEWLEEDVPECAVERTSTLRLADRDYVPCLNWFAHGENEDIDVMKLARDDVRIIQGLFPGGAWGPIIGDTLTMVDAILHACRGKYNVAHGDLMIRRSGRGAKLLADAYPLLADYPFLQHWLDHEFSKLSDEELKRARRKLMPFLTAPEPVRGMFCQTRDKYNLAEIANSGQHLLANVSTGGLSPAITAFSCRLLVRRHYHAAVCRLVTDPSTWMAHDLHIDEAQYATGGSLFGFADLLRECRKVNYRLSVGVQTRLMLSDADRLSLGGIGTVVAFGCSSEEARLLARQFRGRVEEREFMHRRVGEGYALLGNEVVSFKAPPRRKRKGGRARAREIRERSRRERCIPLKEAVEIEHELWGDMEPEPKRGLGQYDRW